MGVINLYDKLILLGGFKGGESYEKNSIEVNFENNQIKLVKENNNLLILLYSFIFVKLEINFIIEDIVSFAVNSSKIF